MPNPLRILGLARVLAGGWFIATGAATLRQFPVLSSQAGRLFAGDIGPTDAPIRSLLALIIAPLLALTGLVVAVRGFGWMRRLRPPPDGPAAIERDEVVAVLRLHQLLAYVDGPARLYWPLRRWLADELAEITSWRRAIVSRSVRIFVRSCALVLVLAGCCLALSRLTTNDLLGPFPASFVVVLPFVTMIWAALALLLIAPHAARIESVELSWPDGADDVPTDRIVESPPRMLHWEPPALGLTLGVAGVVVQCLMLSWWDLSYLSYPLLATALLRYAGSIAGGVVFFVLGDQMMTTGAELLLRCRYESTLVLISNAGDTMVARAAAVRTESRGLTGTRHVVAAVGGSYVRADAERLIRGSANAGLSSAASDPARWQRPPDPRAINH